MCGIWALLSQVKINEYGKLFEAFMKIKNRGPEYSRFDLINDNVLLGFHRLAIMDLSAEGNQPFHYVRPDGSCVYCVCNGEIYDYKKLKEEYKIITKSNSDCEIIIPLYEKLGTDKMIKLLGSEFVFIILDVNKDGKTKMVVGRDAIGVRPLFYSKTSESLAISSELKGLTSIYEACHVFPPGHYMIYENGKTEMREYYKYEYKELNPIPSIEQIYADIRKRLIDSVRKRIMSDRPFGALLSGGLDSSLICGIIRFLVNSEFPELKNKKIPVFTIAFKQGSEDLPYAKQVADYLGFEHHIIEIDENEGLKEVENIVKVTESWDITTNRCSILQYLVAKYIKEKTDVKVLIVGENSDELHCGYFQFHNAPNVFEAKDEGIKLVKNVHTFDGLRTDRTIAYFGLEVRVPFAQSDYVDYIFSLPAHLIAPINGLEKYTLRYAFKDMNIIPENVLMRPKCPFSDSVSKKERSWYKIIQEYIDKIISDEEFDNNKNKFKHHPPYTKESYYYRKKFVEYFGISEETSKVIPYYWLHRWSNSSDPSPRTIIDYKE